jgi:hypothetical protein
METPEIPIIYLLRGRSGSGKDTVASMLRKYFGYVRFAFADVLKQMVAEKYGADISLFHSQEGKKQICPETGKTWRQMLIDEGASRREKDPDIYVKKLVENIEKTPLCDRRRIVITDWRYPNELEYIENSTLAGTYQLRKLHIISPNRPITFDDPSEHALDYRIDDPVLINRDTIEELQEVILQMSDDFLL